jgi:hypothetical protein
MTQNYNERRGFSPPLGNYPAHIAASLNTVFQFRAVPRPIVLSIIALVNLELPMPSG